MMLSNLCLLGLSTMMLCGVAVGAEPAAKWTMTLQYGGGSPHDAGPMGHCTATISGAGTIRVESKNRSGKPAELVVLDNKSLSPEELAALQRAANEAVGENPYRRFGSNEDGNFFVLKLKGDKETTVAHRQLNNFADAPPAMLKLVEQLNRLLPEAERIPLEKTQRSARVMP